MVKHDFVADDGYSLIAVQRPMRPFKLDPSIGHPYLVMSKNQDIKYWKRISRICDKYYEDTWHARVREHESKGLPYTYIVAKDFSEKIREKMLNKKWLMWRSSMGRHAKKFFLLMQRHRHSKSKYCDWLTMELNALFKK